MPGEGLRDDLRNLIANSQPPRSANVVVVVGAGVSVAASGGAPTAAWRGLLEHGVTYCVDKARANEGWKQRQLDALAEDDVDEWLGVATQIERKLGAPNDGEFGNWLDDALGSLAVADDRLIRAIAALNVPISTLNYDRLIERVAGLGELTWRDSPGCQQLVRGEGERKVVHMHGHYEQPETVVLGVASYANRRHFAAFQALQQAVRATKSLVFIGCGGTFEDPNWSALLEWARETFGPGEKHRHYWLVRDDEITDARRKEYREYGIELLGYGPEHTDLASYVEALTPENTGAPVGEVARTMSAAQLQVQRYCEVVERCHEHPLGLFRHHVAQMDTVYVELEVDRSCDDESEPLVDRKATTMDRSTTLEELLQDPDCRRWVVLGDPGAGKTTLARHLVWKLARARIDDPNGGPLPVYVSLPALMGSGQHPFEACRPEVAAIFGNEATVDLGQRLFECARRPNGVWLFLDGLDEVTAEQVEPLRTRLHSWAKELPDVTMVVFSRPIGYQSPGEAFQRVAKIVALDSDRQRKLLGAWLGERADAVCSGLQSRPSLREACRTPLLLSLLAYLIRENPDVVAGQLPGGRAALFRMSIETLLIKGSTFGREGYAVAEGVRDWSGALQVLRHLAARLHEGGGEAWGDESVEEALLEAIADVRSVKLRFGDHGSWSSPRAFLDEIAAKSGVLATYDGGKTPWRFLHRQFKEVLAAEVLRAGGDAAVVAKAKAVQTSKRELARWAGVLGFACELADDPLAVLRELANVDVELALRVLPEVDGIDHVAALSLLLEQGGGGKAWDGDYLVGLIRRWTSDGGLDRDQLSAWLWQQVTPTRSTLELAYLHYALECLDPAGDVVPERERFFWACGRWPEGGPKQLEWKAIPAGSFLMGSEEGEGDGDEHPQHEVTLNGFEMAAVPVTNEQYGKFDGKHQYEKSKARHPLVEVRWWEAYLYCRWLGGGLSTEAQWEYACRAGTTTRYWSGDDESDLARVGWYGANSERRTHVVAEKPANAWGLHDMHGNVWEWTEDWFAHDYEAGHDGDRGTSTGNRGISDRQGTAESRVIRGGSWCDFAGACRSAYRRRLRPGFRYDSVGFRPARVIT